mmetsp:Transcript_29912/g.69702  ORF Transcript_29912/g.69702 Transcript_29912/m.69702 type:complete len:112 (-) Transcript_29912:912-1247(-)
MVVGAEVGLAVGEPVGLAVGNAVGLLDGEVVGLVVGNEEGLAVGLGVGLLVGDAVGEEVGAQETVTSKLHEAVFPLESVISKVLLVVPSSNVAPLGFPCLQQRKQNVSVID